MMKNDLPEWLQTHELYKPKVKRFTPVNFLVKNIKKFTSLNERIQDSKKKDINIFNFLIFIFSILFISVSKSPIFVWVMLIIFLYKLVVRPKILIIRIIKMTLFAASICCVIVLPMILLNFRNFNYLFLFKTLVILLNVNLFTNDLNTTNFLLLVQRLHLSPTLIFILGIMVKYLKVLNISLLDMMAAIQIKSVGKLKHPYQVIGGIFGSLYLNSIKISKDVHDAMILRGYTGEFIEKKSQLRPKKIVYGLGKCIALTCLFMFLGR